MSHAEPEGEAPLELTLALPQHREEHEYNPLALWIINLQWPLISQRCVMSRYDIPAKHTHDTCVVGYDPPLGTFFAQVYRVRRGQKPPRVIHWIGTALREIQTVTALAEALQNYAVIPDD